MSGRLSFLEDGDEFGQWLAQFGVPGDRVVDLLQQDAVVHVGLLVRHHFYVLSQPYGFVVSDRGWSSYEGAPLYRAL